VAWYHPLPTAPTQHPPYCCRLGVSIVFGAIYIKLLVRSQASKESKPSGMG